MEGVGGGELITETAKAEEVAPRVEGDEVGSDGEEGWGEVEEEKEEGGFDKIFWCGA